MKHAKAYLKDHLGLLLFTLLSPFIFLLVFALYGFFTEPFWYALLLYLITAMLLWGLRCTAYIKECKRHDALLAAMRHGHFELPGTAMLAGFDDPELLSLLTGQIRRLADEQLTFRKETQDYYTLWVHQIKTPIAALRMLLESGGDAPAMEAELFRIEQYAGMALQYLRLENISGDLSFREQPLDDLIRAVIRKFAPVFIAKRLRIRYEGTDAVVLTDEKWLSFILEQLLSNAVKYTLEGTVTLFVSDELVLTIADTGIGISPEDLPRIFEKGFTGTNGRMEQRSTGLGLYLCSLAARHLGIRLTAESVPGKGSSFSLHLKKDRIRTD